MGNAGRHGSPDPVLTLDSMQRMLRGLLLPIA